MTTDEDIQRLVDEGLLAERQAEAFVLRDVEDLSRGDAAERMGVAQSTLDNTLRAAREKIDAAEATLAIIEELQRPPSRCVECGEVLGTSWVGGDDGPLCFECAGVDPSAATPER